MSAPGTVIAAADAIREAQRAYMDDRGNEAKGKAVAEAAAAYDRVRSAVILVSQDDLLFAYRGLLVLRTMCKKEDLTAAVAATDEIIARLGQSAPQLPALSSLRVSDVHP